MVTNINDVSTADIVYCPRSLAQIFSNFYITPEEKKVLHVKGVYCDKKGQNFGDHYYDRLRDEFAEKLLSIKVPIALKAKLRDGRPYIFEGYIDRTTESRLHKELNVYLTFVITNLISEEAPIVDASEHEKIEAMRARTKKSSQNIDTIIGKKFSGGRKPNIVLIKGRTAVIGEDILGALGEYKAAYNITEKLISMTNTDEIMNTLVELDDAGSFDFITLSRGGGQGVDVFEDVGIAKTIIAMQTPVVTAIGHADDHTFVQLVADRSFNTPADFGNHLKLLAKDFMQAKKDKIDFTQKDQQYMKRIGDLESANQELQKAYAARISAAEKNNQELQRVNNELSQRPLQTVIQASEESIDKKSFVIGGLIAAILVTVLILLARYIM